MFGFERVWGMVLLYNRTNKGQHIERRPVGDNVEEAGKNPGQLETCEQTFERNVSSKE